MAEARPQTQTPELAPCPECDRLSILSAVDGGKCLSCAMHDSERAQLRAEVKRLRHRELLLILLLRVATNDLEPAAEHVAA